MFTVSSSLYEYAQDRQSSLQQEADQYRLLQQVCQSERPFLLVRRLLLVTGQLLVVSGTWLKASTRLEQSQATVPQRAGRLTRAALP